MMNPDGVFLGNYRGSLLGKIQGCTLDKHVSIGSDLNRVWDTTSSHGHPTVHAVKRIVEKLAASVSNCRLLWIHASFLGESSRLHIRYSCFKHAARIFHYWQCI